MQDKSKRINEGTKSDMIFQLETYEIKNPILNRVNYF